ncbi:NUDIX domain-containing protein [Candidatus Saccharibacteria bacterium]|nr:NUDIX domain-containing protein [Candidatus Saccharibacteria bacterium]
MSDFTEVYNDGTIQVERSEHGWHVWARPAVATLMVRSGKIVLIEDKKTGNDHWLWSCPGGMIEQGESSEEAAARECEEETGLIPTSLHKFTTIPTDFPDTYVDYYLGSDITEGTPAPWIGTPEEMIGKVQDHTWQELYNFAINYQLRDPRLVVAILQLSKQKSLLNKYGLV